MIPHGVEIFVALDPIDLRWSFDRLAGIVEDRVARPILEAWTVGHEMTKRYRLLTGIRDAKAEVLVHVGVQV